MSVVTVAYALVAYTLHITISGRLEGWGGEPGDIALLMIPTLVYYFHHKEISIRSGMTAIAFVLSSSTASFTALFIILSIYLFVHNRKDFAKLISATLVILVVGSIISNYLSDKNLIIMRQQLNLKKHGTYYKATILITISLKH